MIRVQVYANQFLNFRCFMRRGVFARSSFSCKMGIRCVQGECSVGNGTKLEECGVNGCEGKIHEDCFMKLLRATAKIQVNSKFLCSHFCIQRFEAQIGMSMDSALPGDVVEEEENDENQIRLNYDLAATDETLLRRIADPKMKNDERRRLARSELGMKVSNSWSKEKLKVNIEARIRRGKGYQAVQKQRKTQHCPFRLLNVLFSDRFVERFANLGNAASRNDLDNRNGPLINFWDELAEDFALDKDEYGSLKFGDCMYSGVNPSLMVPHSGLKLKNMWADIHGKYKTANSNCRQSGNHSEMRKYCDDNGPVYYLHQLLLLKPNVGNYVDAEVPDPIDTGVLSIEIPAAHFESPKTPKTPSSSKKRRGAMLNMEQMMNDMRESTIPLNSAKLQREQAKAARARLEMLIFKKQRLKLVLEEEIESGRDQEVIHACQAKLEEMRQEELKLLVD